MPTSKQIAEIRQMLAPPAKDDLSFGAFKALSLLADYIDELVKALRQTTEMVLGEFYHPSVGEEAKYAGELTASDIHLLRAANYEHIRKWKGA